MDWKKNRLAIALGVLVFATAAAMLAARSRDEIVAGPELDAAELPQVDPSRVDALSIDRPGDEELRFVKQDGQWRMTAPVESAADQDAVEQAVTKLAELEIASVVSINPALHDRLEVVEDKALHVRAESGGQSVADLYIGPNKASGTLVRVEGQDAVVAVSGSVRFPYDKGAALYRDRVVVDVEPDRVSALTVRHGEATYRFARELPEGEWQLAADSAAVEDFAPAKVKTLVSSLARLRAAGFDPPGTPAAVAGLENPAAEATLELQAEGAEAPQTATLQLGVLHPEDNEYSLRRAGSDVPFRVSKLAGERLLVTAESFQQQAEAAPSLPVNPHAAPGQQELPPEVLRQLQQQLGQMR